MPNLIAQRPQNWNSVIGQRRQIEVLQAVLKNSRFLSRGLILSGPVGVGKTTVSYLLARALMCTGQDPLGCGECPSCQTIATDGIDKHPDFFELDGAVKPGVEVARETVDMALSLPVLGRRRIPVIDEAHFLSSEAWGAYLKTLESGDTDSVFIFVSNEASRIPENIRSRCIRIPFDRVSTDTLIGHLANVATANHISYDMDALKLLAKQAKGIVRDAVQYLDTCGALGILVTVDIVKMIIDTTLDDLCEEVLLAIADHNQTEAIRLADDLVCKDMPGKAAERMLSLYSRSIYTTNETLNKIYVGLPDVGKVAEILAKWAAIQHAPSDVITVIVYELLKTQAKGLPVNTPQKHINIALNVNERLKGTPIVKRPVSPLMAILDSEEL
jgi:DNA polymerase III subunit gamma/tau